MFMFLCEQLQVFRERCRQEVEELRRRQEEVVQVAIRENEESMMRVLRRSKEREEQLRRENKQLEEEQRRKNNETLQLLLNENKSQMSKMLAKQKKEEAEKGKVVKKRKVDQLDATNKQPAAPECPVCFLGILIQFDHWKNFVVECLWHRSALMRWCLPPRSSTVSMVTTSVRPASESKSSDKRKLSNIEFQVRLDSSSLPKVQKEDHRKSF